MRKLSGIFVARLKVSQPLRQVMGAIAVRRRLQSVDGLRQVPKQKRAKFPNKSENIWLFQFLSLPLQQKLCAINKDYQYEEIQEQNCG